MRQAANRVKIEGILAETDLKYGSFQKNGETVESIGGSIKVLVHQEINGVATALEVPVYMFSSKYTKTGKINPSYESIEKVMKEFVSIAAAGGESQADRVRITNADIRKAYTDATNYPDFKQIQEAVNIVLNKEYTLNYIVRPGKEVSNELIPHLAMAANLLIDRRCQFLDLMAVLHGSFRHSPYLRLPLQGISVNKELSFVRPALSEELLNAKDKKTVEKVMSDFGKKLAEHTLAETTKKMLQNRPCQIVAISDLPIEWLDDNGIPLGFTHDVCRMPEFPHSGLIQRYCITSMNHYVVPKDILKHTLVVYGCRDTAFDKVMKESLTDKSMIGRGAYGRLK